MNLGDAVVGARAGRQNVKVTRDDDGDSTQRRNACTGFAECEHVKSQDLVFSLRALKPKSEIHYYYDKGLVDQLVQEQDANRAEGS